MQKLPSDSVQDHGETSICPCNSYAFSSSIEHACMLVCGHHPQCPAMIGYRPKPERLIDGMLGMIEWLDKEVARLGGNPARIRRDALVGFSCFKCEEEPSLIFHEPLLANFEVLLDDDTESDIDTSSRS